MTLQKPCTRCGLVKLRSPERSHCNDCRKEYAAGYYLRTRDKQIAYSIAYQKKHKTK